MTRAVDPTDPTDPRATFRAQGYLLVEQVVPDAYLDEAQRRLAGLVDERIAGWCRDGLLDRSHDDLPFSTRFHRAWLDAGRPPGGPLDPDGILTRGTAPQPSPDWLVALVADVLDTDHVEPEGNSFYRAKFPDDDTTTLPWHQDGQCLESMARQDAVTAWIPMVDVSATTSCLEIAPVGPEQVLYAPTWSTPAGYLCMGDDDVGRLTSTRSMAMRRGDVLLLGPHTPHRSLPNTGTEIRWSLDLRFVSPGHTTA